MFYLKGTENARRVRVLNVTVAVPISTVKECVDNLDQEDQEEKLVSSLWGAERCLRVLESVSVSGEETEAALQKQKVFFLPQFI